MFKIVVSGTGYVGLVAGVCFAEVGHQVICVDVDEQKINLLKQGISPIYEQGLEKLLKKNLAAGRLAFTTDYRVAYKDADAIFIGVRTPEQPDGSVNLCYLASVAWQIAETVGKDCLVVVNLAFPLGAGYILYSDLATKIFLGNKWNEASKVIGVWALTSAIIILLGHLKSEVYRAKGKPKLSFLSQVLHLIALVPVCIISSKYGFWPLVYSRAWIRMQGILVGFIIMKFCIKFPIEKVFVNIMPTPISSLTMGILGYLLKQISESILWSFISIVICSVFYFAVLCLFPGMKKELAELVMRILPNRIADIVSCSK